MKFVGLVFCKPQTFITYCNGMEKLLTNTSQLSLGYYATQNTIPLPQSAGQDLSFLLRQVPTHPSALLSEPNM